FVMNLEVVISDGLTLHTGRKVTRNNTGPSLTQLFIGAEGTLGVITEVTLRVGTKPSSTETRRYALNTLDEAISVAYELERSLFPAINRVDDEPRGYDGKPMITVAFEGNSEVVNLLVSLADGLVEAKQGVSIPEAFADPFVQERRVKTFEMSVSPKFSRLVPEEPCINIRDSGFFSALWISLCKKFGITYEGTQFNISYPGIITYYASYPVSNPVATKSYHSMMHEFYSKIIEFGGSISATHGVGCRMREFVSTQFDSEYLLVLDKLKESFDPNNIFNPGKLYPQIQIQ
ncbi:MAG: FAD-binding oxidoreductase, partial [Nitrososphaerales archaeon]